MNDLISRQALCEYALNQKDKSVTPNDIMRFPSAQPERETGRWIDESVMAGTTIGGATLIRQYRCSVCGNLFGRVDDKFCGRCGARMDLEEQDEAD